MSDAPLMFDWQPRPNVSQLAEAWKALEALSTPNLFTSWYWIHSWWQAYDKADWLLSITQNNRVVGLSLWNERYHKRPLGLHVNALHLHHTGDAQQDQIWPEYSSVLTETESEYALYSQLLAQTFNQHQIDEVNLGLTHVPLAQLDPASDYVQELSLATTAYYVELANDDPIFSSNLRNQLNRSHREAEKLGAVTYTLEPDPSFVRFQCLAPAHQQQWGESSGFSNSQFLRFHERLLANSQFHEGNGCAIATLSVNDQPMAQHYLIRHHNTLYFYLGTAEKNHPARLKPGIMLHAHVIERLLDVGCQRYDFMGGDFQYKQRLSNRRVELHQWRIKRPLARFKVEQTLKQWKARINSNA